jgi:hypothetical protein
MDTNMKFTNLFGDWLKSAEEAAAATTNYAKSIVLLGVCHLTRKATLAAAVRRLLRCEIAAKLRLTRGPESV